MKRVIPILTIVLFSAVVCWAEEVTVTINLTTAEGVGKQIGKITASDTQYGLLLKPEISDLPPGLHGFHVHEHASCDAAKKEEKMTPGQAAGGHFDPKKSGKHLGPYAEGHLGDLPPLFVDANGKAMHPVLAPRLKTGDLKGHAIMIHAGGDNFSDQPEPLGGGGGRIACGVVK